MNPSTGHMSHDELKERGRELYSSGANQVLAGFQIIEESLKNYIECHFNFTRAFLNGRLHFDFRREDYQEAALGRLIQVFSKLCNDKKLIIDLRSLVQRRDHIAHKALLKLYDDNTSPDEYSDLINELQSDMVKISALMIRISSETAKLGTTRAPD